MQSLGIILMCIMAAVMYGIAQEPGYGTRLCRIFYSEPPPIFNTEIQHFWPGLGNHSSVVDQPVARHSAGDDSPGSLLPKRWPVPWSVQFCALWAAWLLAHPSPELSGGSWRNTVRSSS